ncbi:hypothetical protein CPB84DRAFT_1785010 [Gymnopilus junonius]|uniref:Uncharacterized protein n=1 Tax=Gymnopilus junonius TaxID=109634 RepID=A0A9P5NIF8_GYMJU|nr:hypothetical protein CPB84DRAFT_1785010 [Gymnopilus junonius]
MSPLKDSITHLFYILICAFILIREWIYVAEALLAFLVLLTAVVLFSQCAAIFYPRLSTTSHETSDNARFVDGVGVVVCPPGDDSKLARKEVHHPRHQHSQPHPHTESLDHVPVPHHHHHHPPEVHVQVQQPHQEDEQEHHKPPPLPDKEKERKHAKWIHHHIWPHEPLPIPQEDFESPPDGSDRVREWIEGKDRVVERGLGPGEDVEVTVIHQPHNPSIHPKWCRKALVHDLHHTTRKTGHGLSRLLGPHSGNAGEDEKEKGGREEKKRRSPWCFFSSRRNYHGTSSRNGRTNTPSGA